jgi:hypothetical protein
MLPIAARSLRLAIFKPSRVTSVRGTAPKVDGYYPLPSLTSRKVRLSFPEAAALIIAQHVITLQGSNTDSSKFAEA